MHQIRAGFLCKDEIRAGVFCFALFLFSLCTRVLLFPLFDRPNNTYVGCRLNQIRDVVRQLLDDGLIKSLNVLQQSFVVLRDKVDGNPFTTETTGTTDSVQVVLRLRRQVEVDNQRDLLNVDTSGQQISRDQNATGAGAKFSHDDIASVLVHVPVRGGNREILRSHLVRQPIDFSSRVGEDNRLRDRQRFVQIDQRFELPLFLVDVDVELLDTFQSQFVSLDQNSHRLGHKLASNFQRFRRHSRTENANLQLWRQQLENVVNLILETSGQHLIGFVQREDLDRIWFQRSASQHIVHSPRSTDDDVDAGLENSLILSHRRTADARVALHLQIIPERSHNLLDLLRQFSRRRQNQRLALLQLVVQRLQDTGAKRRRLTGTRLRLLNNIQPFRKRNDASLLNRRRFFETVRVNPAQQVLVQVHRIERFVHFSPFGDDVIFAVTFGEFLHTAIIRRVVESAFSRHDFGVVVVK